MTNARQRSLQEVLRRLQRAVTDLQDLLADDPPGAPTEPDWVGIARAAELAKPPFRECWPIPMEAIHHYNGSYPMINTPRGRERISLGVLRALTPIGATKVPEDPAVKWQLRSDCKNPMCCRPAHHRVILTK